MRIEAEQLEYWGNKFTAYGLERYITFAAFMTNPNKYFREIVGRSHRPMLRKRTPQPQRAEIALQGLELALERVERQVQELRRVDNGHIYEQLKHHANRR